MKKNIQKGKTAIEEATPAQKEKFEKEKAKQIDKGKSQFDPDSDEDTTGKSEIFKSGSRFKGQKRK
jgi:hypothetical protein